MSVKSWIVKKFFQGKLPNWVYRLIGRQIQKKLEDKMDTKKWYASKAVWSAILAVLLGAVQPISSALGHPVTVPAWVFELLGGMGLYSLRTGDKPIA